MTMIGKISLNLSMMLYLILYLPQLIHNQQRQHLRQLSISMHVLLFLGYACDFVYGIATHLPWQYLTVSTVGFSLLTIQHFQIQSLDHTSRTRFLLGCLLLTEIMMINTMLFKLIDISPHQAMILGWLSRLFFTLCFIPQLLKNHITQTKHALSPYYLRIHISVTCLDFISAWHLNWGWPNKIGPIISLVMLVLLYVTPFQRLCKKPATNKNCSYDTCKIR